MPFSSRSVRTLVAVAGAVLAAGSPAVAEVAPHPIVSVPFFEGREVVSIAAQAGDPARLYAVADGTLYVSTDGAATWSVVETPPTVSGSESVVNSVATHPWRHGLVFAGVTTHVARSTDGGAAWQQLGSGCIRPATFGFGISDPERFYVSGPALTSGCFRPGFSGCGMVRGDGSAPTSCISEEPAPVIATALHVDPRNADRLLASSSGRLFRSEDGGETWSELAKALRARVLRGHPGDPDVVFAGTAEEGVWRSDDFGSTWARIGESGFSDRITDLEIDPVDPTTLHAIVADGAGLWTSRDGGVTWSAQWHGVPPGLFNDLALAPGDPGVLFLATDSGLYRRELVDDRPCVADARTLCLLDGRVRVEVAWRAFDGSSGLGAAVPATDESGWFWFFDEANPELVVKALDGRTVNGHLWLFHGSLSNVEMTMTATDTLGGEIVSFYNPPGRFASAGHTTPFARPLPSQTGSGGASTGFPLALSAPVHSTTSPTTTSCADPGALCLHDRFRVTVDWQDFFGNEGQGVPLPLTSDAGFFWFFEPGNLELVVKVLDAEPVNGHWWVFYGALSNVAYRLRVEDTLTGEERIYVNPLHHFGSRGDTAAFPTTAPP